MAKKVLLDTANAPHEHTYLSIFTAERDYRLGYFLQKELGWQLSQATSLVAEQNGQAYDYTRYAAEWSGLPNMSMMLVQNRCKGRPLAAKLKEPDFLLGVRGTLSAEETALIKSNLTGIKQVLAVSPIHQSLINHKLTSYFD